MIFGDNMSRSDSWQKNVAYFFALCPVCDAICCPCLSLSGSGMPKLNSSLFILSGGELKWIKNRILLSFIAGPKIQARRHLLTNQIRISTNLFWSLDIFLLISFWAGFSRMLLFRRRLFLKSRAEVCAVYIFPLIFYRLSVLPLPKNHRLALQRPLSKLLWGDGRPMVRRQVCCQRPWNGGLGMPDLENHWFAERLTFLGRSLSTEAVWRRKAKDTFLRFKTDPKAEGWRKPRGEAPFAWECCKALRNFPWSSDLSLSRKELYRELVWIGPAGQWRKFSCIELGTRFGLLERFRVLAHLAACTERVAPFRPELQTVPGRHARLWSLRQWFRKNHWEHLLLLQPSSSVLESYRRVDGQHRTQAAHAARCWLRRGQHFASVSRWEACGVSRDPSCS